MEKATIKITEKERPNKTNIEFKIRRTSKFIRDLTSIVHKYEWYISYERRGGFEFSTIRGKKAGDAREFCPLTAYVYESTGKYFPLDRFDLAASEIYLPAECAMTIIDSVDEWPDRAHKYSPRNYEIGVRDQILRAVKLKG